MGVGGCGCKVCGCGCGCVPAHIPVCLVNLIVLFIVCAKACFHS